MSILFVVATPIGNPGDITRRAEAVLAQVDLVAAEDTRRAGRLLKRLGLEKKLVAVHEHNEDSASAQLLSFLAAGKEVALISDAGTPLVSDPGYQLVRDCHQAGITVTPVPGVSAVTAALSVAAVPVHHFTFEGFIPARQGARLDFLAGLRHERRTLVMFEAPHRVAASLQDMKAVFGGGRLVSICRELTKTFEQVVCASLDHVCEQLATNQIPQKGEFVILLTGAKDGSRFDADALLAELVKEMPASKAAGMAARLTNLPRDGLYKRALALKKLK